MSGRLLYRYARSSPGGVLHLAAVGLIGKSLGLTLERTRCGFKPRHGWFEALDELPPQTLNRGCFRCSCRAPRPWGKRQAFEVES